MNHKVLPPKRFEDPYDPYFDPIRHERWFKKLLTRREKNFLLKGAFTDMRQLELSQHDASLAWGVNVRELRDYTLWADKTPRKAVSAQEQAILDGAYGLYCFHPEPFQYHIRQAAPLFGVKGRPIEELWETHPSFYPRGYPPRHG